MPRKLPFIVLIVILLLTACVQVNQQQANVLENADSLLIVDCLLPPQIRKLGSTFSYAAARRPIRTSASECEIRGGEYVAYDRADYRTALTVWLPQAQSGDQVAQNYVGQVYEKGLGVAADYEMARHWYALSAEQGHAEAQINLGYLYEKGLGVGKDQAMALNWYRKASGIDDDSLQFASSVEVARVSQDQLSKLQEKLNDEREKNRQMKGELTSLRTSISNQEQSLRLAEANKRSKELELQLLKGQKDAPDSQRAHQLEQEIASFEKNLTDGEQKLQNYSERERTLRSELDMSTLQLASAELNQGLMSIEVIDPLMSITRGVRGTRLGKEIQEKEIVGRVNAQSRVKALKINGAIHQLDEFNMFWVKVPILDSVTSVNIQAVDDLGQEVDFSFSIFADRNVSNISNSTNALPPLGEYRALIVGNNDYQDTQDLKTAVHDAVAAEKLLRVRYGFKTTLLKDATRNQILSELDNLRRTSKEEDNILVYFAGHGEIDPETNFGYWLPVDANIDNLKSWISNESITDMISTMPARHVLVVADSCYSGTLAQSNLASSSVDLAVDFNLDWVKAMDDVKARTVLTSGGVKPVLDIGGGQHSLFSEAFLSVLSENDQLIDGHGLYREILKRMRVSMARINQVQVPEYAPIKHAGHEGGEFFLNPKL